MAGYVTVQREARGEFIEKKSRFIGSICPVDSEQKRWILSRGYQRSLRRHHNVWCYVLREGQRSRFSDASEPSRYGGAAGAGGVCQRGVSDVCLVVTRYFGGILLGAGGLTRAYAAGAKVALDAAGLVRVVPFSLLEMDTDYSDYQRLEKLADDWGVKTEDTIFSDRVRLSLAVLKEKTDAFMRAARDLTSGRVKMTMTGYAMRPQSIERGEGT